MTHSIQRTRTAGGFAAVAFALSLAACGGGGGGVSIDPAKTIKVSGTGSGRITSSDGKIDCKLTLGTASGPSCSTTYGTDDTLSLDATPEADHEFVSWGGGCSGTSRCRLKVAGNVDATVQFAAGVQLTNLELVTPVGDDGGAIIKIDGPSIPQIVPSPGIEVASRPAGAAAATSKTIMVRGNLASGVIARVGIRGVNAGATYTAEVKAVAGRQSAGYVQRRDLSGYRATLKQ